MIHLKIKKSFFPDEFEKLEEDSNNYISESKLEIFKIEFPDEKSLLSKKSADPSE